MRLFTSYYSCPTPPINPVSISRSAPPGYVGRTLRWLAPTASMLKDYKAGKLDSFAYTALYYRDVLDKFDPAETLGRILRDKNSATLLCCAGSVREYSAIVVSWRLGFRRTWVWRWRKLASKNSPNFSIDGLGGKCYARPEARLVRHRVNPITTFGLTG
jgi:hypothetical protein